MVNSLLVAVVSLAAIALFLAFINAIKSRKQAGTGGTNGNDEKWWSMKYLWAIPISLVGIAILWGTFGTSGTPSGSAGTWLQAPSLATVVEWKNVYWLPILIVLGVVYFLAARSEEEVVKETATAVLAITAFMLFIGFPVWVWATGPSTTQKSVKCSPFSPDETKTCVLSGDWSSPITADRPTKAGEFEFCVTTPVGKTYESRKVGDNVFELRSTSNEKFPIRYRLLAGTCPDNI